MASSGQYFSVCGHWFVTDLAPNVVVCIFDSLCHVNSRPLFIVLVVIWLLFVSPRRFNGRRFLFWNREQNRSIDLRRLRTFVGDVLPHR